MQLAAGPLRLHVSRVSHNGRAPRPSSITPDEASMRELGSSGESVYSSIGRKELNPKLRGKKALDEFDNMYRTNPQARAAFLLVAMPVLSAQWYVQPYSSKDEDVEVAEMVDWNLHNMHHPFLSFIREALWSLKYGYYVFEKAYEPALWTPRREGAHTREVVKWKRFGVRHPRTLDDDWERDENGVPKAVWHTKVDKDGKTERVLLPRNKLLLYSWDSEADDPHGTSIYRSAYMSAYFQENLYRVDAIQKERHGIGVPRVKLLPGFKPEDKKLANEIGRNLRTNEKAHVTQNPAFEVDFIELHGQVVNALESAQHHGSQIMSNILGKFAESTSAEGEKRTGAQADVFGKALRYLGDFIAMEINQNAIPELVDYHFTVKGYPKLRVRRITENVEWRTMSVALQNLGNAGFITPTPELEAWLTDQMDFPQPSTEALGRGLEERIKKPAGEKEKEGKTGSAGDPAE